MYKRQIIGRIKIKGIEVGDAGILIVSLIAGHFGVTCPSFAKSIGIVLFVASVGSVSYTHLDVYKRQA